MNISWLDLMLPPINLWNVPVRMEMVTMITHKELKEKLKDLPETDLLELLEIYSDELVDRFPDKIEEKLDYLLEELEE